MEISTVLKWVLSMLHFTVLHNTRNRDNHLLIADALILRNYDSVSPISQNIYSVVMKLGLDILKRNISNLVDVRHGDLLFTDGADSGDECHRHPVLVIKTHTHFNLV